MNWRWLIFDYVDPQLKLSRAERRRIRRTAKHLAWSDRKMLPASARPSILVSGLHALVPALVMGTVFIVFFVAKASAWLLIPALIGQIALSWFLMALIGRWTWRPGVLLTLRRAGHEVCLQCGYWLRDLSDATECCPECGTRRTGPADDVGG